MAIERKAGPKAVAVLLLGGKGERYQSDLPKQFVEMGGKPLFLYAYETFQKVSFVNGILLVVKRGYTDLAESLIKDKTKLIGIVDGGDSREDSALNGLKALKDTADSYTLVFIHDADRPLVTENLVERLYEKASKTLFAVPAVPISDTIAYAPKGDYIEHYGDRRGNVTLSTPQVAAYSLFVKAFGERKGRLRDFTDDASVVMDAIGVKPAVVRGEITNIKVNDREGEKLFLRLLKGEKDG